jgi:predicted transcriptional regulator
MITAEQIKAARALLGWSQPQLVAVSGVSLPTIVRMESSVGPGRSSASNVDAVRQSLENAGVMFLSADEIGGPGVRLKK